MHRWVRGQVGEFESVTCLNAVVETCVNLTLVLDVFLRTLCGELVADVMFAECLRSLRFVGGAFSQPFTGDLCR